MSGLARRLPITGIVLAATLLPWLPAQAQQQQPFGGAQQQQPAAQQRPPARTTAPAARPAEPKADASASQARGGGDAQLRQRIEQLEEQLTDMQVVIGTLESLAKTGGGGGGGSFSAPAARGNAAPFADDQRLDSLETQIRALTMQLEQLADQVRQLGGRRTDAGGSAAGGTFANRDGPPSPRGDTGSSRQSAPATEQAGGAFGSMTVTPGPERDRGDAIGRVLSSEQPQPMDRGGAAPGFGAPASGGGQAGGNPKELYETAYGYLLQQDYGAAEVAFEEFLQRYPSDRLAADAQYWLGETLYVQKRYKPAAQAFLKVMQSYQGSAKVPNSLLKLAMTLEQLGQKDCALFSELDSRHPNASADIKNRAKLVRARVGC
jgi:tol-pal system protein YbgF